MRVDEARQDRGPRQVDRPVRVGNLADADALDVAPVDEDPLPHRRVGQRVDPRGTVQGLHRRASLARSGPAQTRHRRRRTRRWSIRERAGVEEDPRLGLRSAGDRSSRGRSGRPTRPPRRRVRTGRRRPPIAGGRSRPPAALGPPARGRRWPGPPTRPDRREGPRRRSAPGPRGTPRPRPPSGSPHDRARRRRSTATSTRSIGGRRRTRSSGAAAARPVRAGRRTAAARAATAAARARADTRSMTRPGWPSPKATGAPRSRARTARQAPRSAREWGRRAGRTAARSPRDGPGRTGPQGRWMSRPRRLPGSEEVEPHPDEARVVPRWSARRQIGRAGDPRHRSSRGSTRSAERRGRTIRGW